MRILHGILVALGVSAAVFVSFAPSPASPAGNLQTERDTAFARTPVPEFDRFYVRLIDSIALNNGTALYQAQQSGVPLLHAVFGAGSPEAQLRVLRRTAAFVQTVPRYGSVIDADTVGAVTGVVGRTMPMPDRVKGALARRGATIDQLPLPRDDRLRAYRIFPIESEGRVAITTGNIQQFGYLLSTLVRLAAAASPPAGQEAAWRAALTTVYRFTLDDVLRLYWLEAPAWHWAGPYTGVRARTLARLDGDPKLSGRRFFRAFVDYDVHLFAIGADLHAAQRSAPWLVAAPRDRALTADVWAIALRALKARIETGAAGRSFSFDRGYWDDNPIAEYAACQDAGLPQRPCRRSGYVTDVSHAQRWPLWLESFAAAAGGDADAATVAAWRRALARTVADKVIRYRGTRPLMTNYLDGSDGWFLYSGPGPDSSGQRPSSLTGWAMRAGVWARLADVEPRLATAYRRFCAVISSDAPEDVAFRTLWYGAPSSDAARAFASNTDEYGPTSSYVLACRAYAALDLI